jgi:hypothetical protein
MDCKCRLSQDFDPCNLTSAQTICENLERLARRIVLDALCDDVYRDMFMLKSIHIVWKTLEEKYTSFTQNEAAEVEVVCLEQTGSSSLDGPAALEDSKIDSPQVEEADSTESESDDEDFSFDKLTKEDVSKLVKLINQLEEQDYIIDEKEKLLERQEGYIITKIEEIRAFKEENEDLKAQIKMLTSKNEALQNELLISYGRHVDSLIELQVQNEVMFTLVTSYQSHQYTRTHAPHSINLSCANPCYSQAMQSSVEHVVVETCDDLIASENDKLKQEVERLKVELSQAKSGVCG